MKKFSVQMPIAGYVYLEVEADCIDSAKEAFHKKVSKCMETHDNIFDHPEAEGSWGFYEQTGSGNVCYLECRSVDVNEIND